MKKELTKNVETLINYGTYSLVICALAGIGFFFDVWEPAAVLFFSSIIIFPVLWMNLYLYEKPQEAGSPLKASSIILLSIGRIFFLLVNIIVSAVMLKFTDGIGGKYRLLYVLLTFVPVALAFLLFYLKSKKEGTTNLIQEELDEEASEIEEEIINGDELIDKSNESEDKLE